MQYEIKVLYIFITNYCPKNIVEKSSSVVLMTEHTN